MPDDLRCTPAERALVEANMKLYVVCANLKRAADAKDRVAWNRLNREFHVLEEVVTRAAMKVHEERKMAAAPPVEPRWPTGCKKPGTCSRHVACMYRPCRWAETDIGPAIEAANNERGG